MTKTPGQPDCQVIFRMKHEYAPYLITKPLHATQKVLSEDAAGKIFSIKVVLNFELERELLGFGSGIQVLGPRILRKRILEQLRGALKSYDL